MSKQINLNDNNWIDIVFENRNHEYGAYQIRKNYNKNSLLGILGMFSFLGLAFGGIVLFSSFKSSMPEEVVVPPLYDTIYIVMPELPPLEEEKIEPEQNDGQTNFAETIKNTIPDIVPDNTIPSELLPPTDDELKNTNSGTVTNTGSGTTIPTEVIPTQGNGTGESPILLIADEMPEFPGGEDALISYINKHSKFTDLAREYNVTGTIYVSFVVDEQGDVVGTKVERGIGYGMDEMLCSVINNLPKFKPAKQNDHAVKVRMMVPVKFEWK